MARAGRTAFAAILDRLERVEAENVRLKAALEGIRDYDIAAHSKYGIETSDEQAKAMWVMRKMAKKALVAADESEE